MLSICQELATDKIVLTFCALTANRLFYNLVKVINQMARPARSLHKKILPPPQGFRYKLNPLEKGQLRKQLRFTTCPFTGDFAAPLARF